MARKMIVLREDGSSPVLTETLADDEAQLQELVKDNPDLLPTDEFGIAGPLMVVGRETTLPSGAVDLLALARGGEVLIIEFKIGPQNADFRRVLAQLLDYGSDLWRMSYDEFESTVAQRYFGSLGCRDGRLRGKSTLADVAVAIWPDFSAEEAAQLRERLTELLANGGFRYVLVAQRFAPTTLRTVEYLNVSMPTARFYAVELVRFGDQQLSAFESRTLLKPSEQSTSNKQVTLTSEARFLESIPDETYRAAVHELLEVCRGLGLRFEWGSKGTPIRLPTADGPEPLSIGWLFPPGVAGWSSLRDLTLGVDTGSAARRPSVAPAIEAYLARAASLPGAEPVRVQGLRAYHLAPDALLQGRGQMADVLAELVHSASGNP